ncbi:MAG: hypothetical protein WD208_10025 [Dehalococcoidia bacterium]
MAGIKRRKYALISAVILLVVVELVVRTSWFWELSPTSTAQEPLEVFEAALETYGQPDVVILGNSITRNAISPPTVEAGIGVTSPNIINASLSGGMMTDYLTLYIQNREAMQSASVLVVGIEPRSFDNQESAVPENPSRFRRYASLSQRWAIEDTSEKVSLLAGALWRTWDARQQLYGYLGDLVVRRDFDRSEPGIDGLGRIAIRPSTRSIDPDGIVNHARQEAQYRFVEGVQFHAYEMLIELARQDGLRLALITLPQSELWLREYYATLGPEAERWEAAVEEVAGVPVETVQFPRDQCRAMDDCYIDYGHMNERGAAIYSIAFGEWLTPRVLGIALTPR